MRKYVQQRFNENMDLYNPEGVGQYGVPEIYPEDYVPCKWISFNYAKQIPLDIECMQGVHFFLDDYQFERIWRRPQQNADRLFNYAAVLSPDFSLFADYPKALQIYNHFRKQWFGSYLQSLGITVYPTIGWSDKESYAWCFDGCPHHATVAVSSIGTLKNKHKTRLFLDGYNAMLDTLEPVRILFYGNVPRECEGNIIKIEPFVKRFEGRKTDED